MEPSEDSVVLRKNLQGLVKTIPERLTGIVASITKLLDVAKFYALVAGDYYSEESGKQDFAGSIGVLRYIISFGDTSVEKYRSLVDP